MEWISYVLLALAVAGDILLAVILAKVLHKNNEPQQKIDTADDFVRAMTPVLQSETDLLAVAVREAQEETGLVHVAPVSRDIFSLETIWVEGHEKRGKYVPCHLHLNITYLLEADDGDVLRAKPDENSGVRWFTLDEAVAASTEEWMRARVYEKLNRKVRALG